MGLISCSLGKQSNNVFYGFSSVKCGTSGILRLVDVSKMKSMIFQSQLKSSNRDSSNYHVYHAEITHFKAISVCWMHTSEAREQSGCHAHVRTKSSFTHKFVKNTLKLQKHSRLCL